MKKIKLYLLVLNTFLCFGVTAQIPTYVPTTGLVGWWPFNGNSKDESGAGNNGTVNGASLTNDRFGLTSSAYAFDGINDFISTNYSGILGTKNRTIQFWAKHGQSFDPSKCASCSYLPVISYGSNVTGPSEIGKGINCSFNVGATGVGLDGNETNATFDGIKPINDNQWHHYVYVLENISNVTTVKIYQDSQLLSKILWKYLATNNINTKAQVPLQFGIRTYNTSGTHPNNYYKGELDDIGFWDRALTSKEIALLYTGAPANKNSNCDLMKKACFSVEPKSSQNLVIEPGMSYMVKSGKFKRKAPSVSLEIGQWSHLAFAKKDTTIYIYKNGKLQDSTSYLKGYYYSWNKMILGAAYFTNYIRYFKGAIDDVRYSDQIRTPSEILANYNSGSPAVNDSKTKALWNLDTVNNTTGVFGSIIGASGTSKDVKLTNGKYGKAFQFNGYSAHADINSAISNNNHTVELWIKPDSFNISWPLCYYGTNSAGFLLQVDTSYVKYKWSTGDTGLTTCVNPNNTKFVTVTDGNCTDTLYLGWNKQSVTTYDTILTKVTDTLLINVTFSNTKGIQTNVVKVYPNPTSTEITIDFNDYNSILGYKVEIVDISGKTVYNTTVSQKQVKIDLSSWTGKGIYFVRISDLSGKPMEVKKIILQ